MEIVFWDDSVNKFIKSLNKPTIAKTTRTIELLEFFGSKLTMPYSKKIGDNLFELRIRGAQEVRILFTFKNNKAILIHGFIKKDRKIPKRHIDKAFKILRSID